MNGFLYLIFLLLIFLIVEAESKRSVLETLFNSNKSTKKQTDKLKLKSKLLTSRGGGSKTTTYDNTSSTQQQSNHPAVKNPYSYITDTSHSTSATDLLQQLQVSSNQGLTKHQVQLRYDILGPNAIKMQSSDPFWKLLLEQFDDRLVQTLVGVAIFSSFLASFEQNVQSFIEPIVIMTCLLINAFVGVMHAKSAEGSLDALKKLQPSVCCVLRDHVWLNDYPSSELVIGDMILLRVGSKVPADARLVSFYTPTFTVDESSLTGESLPELKSTEAVSESTGLSGRTCMVYSSTMVTSGSALAVVTGTGTFTEIGQISAGVEEAREHHMKTPLAEKLDVFSSQLSKIVLAICALVFMSNIPKFNDKNSFISPLQGAIHYLKIAVALGVAAIPEGLPAVVTLCLSLGTRRMAARNVIVRKLASVETLGCTSVICTDKTGTLTTNRMVVKTLITFSAAGGLKHESKHGNIDNKGTEYNDGSNSGIHQHKSDIYSHTDIKIKSIDHITDINDSTTAINDSENTTKSTPTTAATDGDGNNVSVDSELDNVVATAKDLGIYPPITTTTDSNTEKDTSNDTLDTANSNINNAKKANTVIYSKSDIDIIATSTDSNTNTAVASINGGYSSASTTEIYTDSTSPHANSDSAESMSGKVKSVHKKVHTDGVIKSTLLSTHKNHNNKHHHHSSSSGTGAKVYGVERSVGGDSYNPFQGTININPAAATITNSKEHKSSSSSSSSASIAISASSSSSWHDISLICAMCNQAEVELVPPTTNDNSNNKNNNHHNNHHGNNYNNHHSFSHTAAEYKAVGEPTEAALRVLVEKIGIGKQQQHYMPINNDITGDNNGASITTIAPALNARECSDYWSRMYHRLAILEFTRERKRMSVLCRTIDSNSNRGSNSDSSNTSNNNNNNIKSSSSTSTTMITNRLLVKGAAEMVLEKCTFIKLEDGTITPITDTIRHSLQALIAELASRPLRCVALAYTETKSVLGRLRGVSSQDEARDCLTAQSSSLSPSTSISSAATTESHSNNHHHKKNKSHSVSDIYDHYEEELVLVGICGIRDPPRPLVADSMALSRSAGVRVMMITGDSKDTAVAIAREIGIFQSSIDEETLDEITDTVKDNQNSSRDTTTTTTSTDADFLSTSAFTTKEFFAKSRDEQLSLLKTGNKVFCRAEPRDKQILITMLEQLGEVTAMTGDGVNDAPALKQADIGIAMGIAGTEVAKQAADMILADDDFNSILAAVEEGRNIYNNMQAFVSFLLSCNIGEIAAILLSSVLGIPTPLSPLHLLWVNLVTDGPPATALGFNPPDPLCMARPPRPRHDSLLTPWLLTRYCITGAYVGLATITAFVWWFTERDISFVQLLRHSNEVASATYYMSPGGLAYPQSLSLSVLVAIEMLKALSAVSLNQSLFVVPPWRNPYLLASVGVSFSLHVLLLQTPALATLFGLHGLTRKDWWVVLMLSLPVLLLEEGLKWIGRRVQQDQQPTAAVTSTTTTANKRVVIPIKPSTSSTSS